MAIFDEVFIRSSDGRVCSWLPASARQSGLLPDGVPFPGWAIPTPSPIIRWCRRPPARPAGRNVLHHHRRSDAAERGREFRRRGAGAHDNGRPSVRGAEGARQYGHRRGRQGDGRPVRDDPRQRRLPLPCKPNDPLCVDDPLPLPVVVDPDPTSPVTPPIIIIGGAAVRALSAPLAACPNHRHGSWE